MVVISFLTKTIEGRRGSFDSQFESGREGGGLRHAPAGVAREAAGPRGCGDMREAAGLRQEAERRMNAGPQLTLVFFLFSLRTPGCGMEPPNSGWLSLSGKPL